MPRILCLNHTLCNTPFNPCPKLPILSSPMSILRLRIPILSLKMTILGFRIAILSPKIINLSPKLVILSLSMSILSPKTHNLRPSIYNRLTTHITLLFRQQPLQIPPHIFSLTRASFLKNTQGFTKQTLRLLFIAFLLRK
jgi:hypothetical protein